MLPCVMERRRRTDRARNRRRVDGRPADGREENRDTGDGHELDGEHQPDGAGERRLRPHAGGNEGGKG